MEFERSRIPIIQPCSERNAGHLTCIACIRSLSYGLSYTHLGVIGCVPLWMRTTARCVGVMLLVSSLYRTNHALLYFVMSLHPVMNDEVLLPNGIIPFLLYPFRYIKRTRIKKVAVTIILS